MSIKMKKLQERGSKTFPITQDCYLPWPLLYVHKESIPLPQCYNMQYQKMREDKVELGKFSVPYEWVNCGIYEDPFREIASVSLLYLYIKGITKYITANLDLIYNLPKRANRLGKIFYKGSHRKCEWHHMCGFDLLSLQLHQH